MSREPDDAPQPEKRGTEDLDGTADQAPRPEKRGTEDLDGTADQAPRPEKRGTAEPDGTADQTEAAEPEKREPAELSDAPGRGGRAVTMARGAYLGLVATAIAGIAVGAFFAGYVVSSDDYVTQAQLESALARAAPAPAPVQAPPAPAPVRPASISADDDPVLGSPGALVTIVEFSDFECPFCARFHRDTLPVLKAAYIDTGVAKLVYRDFPLDRIHPNARAAHAAAECADEQGMFWPYHDVLFDRQGEWSSLDPGAMGARVLEYASAMPLDAGAFAECLSSPEVGAEIEADRRAGSGYGVTGTPAFFVGSEAAGYEHINGAKPFESFAAAIESALG